MVGAYFQHLLSPHKQAHFALLAFKQFDDTNATFLPLFVNIAEEFSSFFKANLLILFTSADRHLLRQRN